MPMYEYKCPRCGRIIEVLQGFDDPAPHCIVCAENPQQRKEQEKVTMRRLISRTSFQLKGDGWEKDGYGGGGGTDNG